MKNIVDIYVRLSDEDRNKNNKEEESESIQNQKKMLIDYCKNNNWEINAIYSDEDFSGVDNKRPGWNNVLKDCEEGRCSIVLCKTQSRFSRDMEMIEKYIHGKFLEWGIRFVSIVDNADTNIKGNKKARQINGLINEWYLDDLSENIKATLSTKRKNGEFVGSFAPYGYLVDPKDKNHLIIDEEAARVVKQIFNMYINGFGYISIAKHLNDNMIPTPCERKKELGLKYYNWNYENNYSKKQWSEASIYAIIRRRVYTGALEQGKQTVANYKTGARRKKPQNEWDIVENTHEPIISKEIFLLAEEIRNKKGKSQKNSGGTCYSLARKVYCGTCGNTMWKTSYNVSGKRHNYLTCRTRKTSNGICNNKHHMKVEDLEGVVLNELNKLIEKYFDKNKIGYLEKSDISNEKDLIISRINKQKNKIKLNNDRIYKTYLDKLDGIINFDEYKTVLDRIKSENLKIEELIKLLTDELSSCEKINEITNHIDTLTFLVAEEFIDRIYVYNLNEDKTRKIIIEWKI